VFGALQDAGGASGTPVLATSPHKLLLLTLGGNVVAMYQSTLPFRQPLKFQQDTWKRPIFVIVMVAVACWKFAELRC
jgi:hypothetical protein